MMTFKSVLIAGATGLILTSAAVAQTPAVSSPNLAPMALNSLPNPPDKIATARVVDDKGVTVGAVQKVEMDQSGKPLQVQIALLGSDRIVALPSSQLSYDLPNNVVTAAMDKTAIAQLPPAPQG